MGDSSSTRQGGGKVYRMGCQGIDLVVVLCTLTRRSPSLRWDHSVPHSFNLCITANLYRQMSEEHCILSRSRRKRSVSSGRCMLSITWTTGLLRDRVQIGNSQSLLPLLEQHPSYFWSSAEAGIDDGLGWESVDVHRCRTNSPNLSWV